MSSFNQLAPSVPTILNTSNCFIFSNSSSGNALSVQQLGAGNVASFRTTTGSTALFINPAGNVGVGTAAPLAPFHTLFGNSGIPDTTGSGTSNVATRFQVGSVALDMGNIVNGNMWLQNHLITNWATNFKLLLNPNGGYVGIGTTDPGSALHTTCNSASATTVATFENLNITNTTNKSFNIQFYGRDIYYTQKDIGSINIIPTEGNWGYSAIAFNIRGPFASGGNEGLAEIMRFTRSGTTPCVGIGTTNPAYKLQVTDGGASTTATMCIDNPTVANTTFGARLLFTNRDTNGNQFGLGAIYAVRTNSVVNYDADVTIAPSLNGTIFEGMRVTASGRVGIGLTNPSYPLHVNGTVLSSSQNLKYIDYNSVPNWTTVTPGQTALSIYGSGKIGTGDAFVIFSDSRIKVEEQPPASYLEIVSNVDVKNFSYIDKVQYGPQKRIGFFAQEVENVLPDAVSKINDFTPNIFRKCSAEGNCVTVVNHGLLEGVKIRIISSGEKVESIVHVVDENTIQVDKDLDPEVFVFGTEVDDFRVLNNDYMSAVGFGGLKELHALVKTQQTTIETLSERLSALEAKLNSQ